VARARGPISHAERAALVAREHVLAIRRGVHLFHLLRERRGVLTLAQIRRMSRLLTAHADALYRRADRVERGSVMARVPKGLSLAALARRVGQVGQGDDPVTRSTVDRLIELRVTVEGRATTPAAIRTAAIEVVRLAETVSDARSLPRWRPPPRPRGGRHPNVPLDSLLHYAVKRGITDAELADELARQEIQPDGPGSERLPRHRWMAILKSARARRRRTTTGAP
jgi:hypothetical protein